MNGLPKEVVEYVKNADHHAVSINHASNTGIYKNEVLRKLEQNKKLHGHLKYFGYAFNNEHHFRDSPSARNNSNEGTIEVRPLENHEHLRS